jgi:putative transcriptional regulator
MNTKLVAYRKMLNINQSEMAQKIGCSYVSYSKKETGKVQFSQNEMIAVINALKEKIPEVTMDEIFFIKGVGRLLTNTV